MSNLDGDFSTADSLKLIAKHEQDLLLDQVTVRGASGHVVGLLRLGSGYVSHRITISYHFSNEPVTQQQNSSTTDELVERVKGVVIQRGVVDPGKVSGCI